VVLVTSRTVLRLSGEHEFPVAPLPTPPASTAGAPRLADLRRFASVRLFVERAHAAAPAFELAGENARAVAEICRRLDGLPLAIELAAARVRVLPPRALLARLDDRMSLLTGGARDLPERQRTLRKTLDLSFGLLSPAERVLFGRLGVFPGTFDLEAAEAVGAADASIPAGWDHAGEIIDTLGSLVDASLVRDGDRFGQPRFSMLGTIRDYSRERLRESDQWKEAHDRHAAHFLALADCAKAGLEGSGQVAWLDRLEAEHDNLGPRCPGSWIRTSPDKRTALAL
jgi:predicted ATPase